MTTLLLAIIYMAFISLGLPDSLMGSAWPVMHEKLDVPYAYAGILSAIIAAGSIISSLLSDRLTRTWGTGKVTAVSVMATALALLGFSFSNAFWMLCVWAIPYGVGAGAVDAALNHYVALHYTQRHMHWLHCFWGVGVSVSPYIMSASLLHGLGWSGGYWIVGLIQSILTLFLFLSLPLWHTCEKTTLHAAAQKNASNALGLRGVLKLPGVRAVIVGFFCYCGLETSVGLWASSYLVLQRGFEAEIAARWGALFFLGITAGRFLSGIIAAKLSDRNFVRIGLAIIFLGIVLMMLPGVPHNAALCGLIIVGLGCAPVYPGIIHEIPSNFGTEHAHAVIGIQMAGTYIGVTLLPPAFGFLAGAIGMGYFPLWLLTLFAVMTAALECKNHATQKRRQA